MSAIKNLLFDLGGVIIDLSPERCVASFEKLGLADAASLLDPYAQTGVFGAVEDGSMAPAQFFDELRRHAGRPDLTDGELTAAFTDFLRGLPVERLAALRALRRRHKVYLLSNTNPVMMEAKIRQLFRQEGLEMDDYFDGVVVSYRAGACKPDRRIFDHAVATLGIDPGETLFLDDSQANVDAARALGFKAVKV